MSRPMSRGFHPGSEPQPQLHPTRILQRPSSALTNTAAADLPHGEHVPAARLEQRIAALRAEVAAAERKRHGIDSAITSRRQTLTRLHAQLILERGGAPSRDE